MSACWLAIGILAIRLTMSASGDVQLIAKIVEETGFIVVGISTRTTNAKEMSGKGVIAQQWDRFMKEGLLSKIPNKVDSKILAVYTDYESDANGAYSYILGARGKLGRRRSSWDGSPESSSRAICCVYF